jgi:hypothetical protein
MSDKNFRNNTHEEEGGTTGSEGLIFNVNAIESFRPIPFSELIRNNKLKSNYPEAFKKFAKWYESMKYYVGFNFFRNEYIEKYPDDNWGENEWNFYKSISKKIEDKIDELSDDVLKKIASDNKLRW